MKKNKVIFGVIFLAIIFPLAFLTVKTLLKRDNAKYTKISWEKPEEEAESRDNLILAPFESPEVIEENSLKEAEKSAAKAGEESFPAPLAIKDHLVSWGFTKVDKRSIDTLIIHSSYDALSGNPYSLEGLIKEYQQYGVAPHYLINREGTIYRLVAEKNVAYHAGESQVPDGRKNVNSFSLGVEIINTKTDLPTREQYAALQKLIDFLKEQYAIKYILGHNQIAEGRKDDPWNFDWKKIKK